MINLLKKGSFKKIILTTVLLLVLSFLFASCSGMSTNEKMNTSEGGYYTDHAAPQQNPTYPGESEDSGVGDGNVPNQSKDSSSTTNKLMSQRKMIMDGEVSLETMYFDDSITAMDQLIDDFGGFAEVRNVTGKSQYSGNRRSASYVIRVPAESFKLVLKSMGNVGTVLDSNSKGTDITDQYYDIQARIKTLSVQEQTLLDILSKAMNLEDVITLEQRLAEVRYEIESLENSVRNYDRLVAFSRITIFVQEVDDRSETRPTPKTLGERISDSFRVALEDFKRDCEDFLVWLVGSWISIIILIIIAAAVIVIFKAFKRRRIKKKAQVILEPPKEQPTNNDKNE